MAYNEAASLTSVVREIEEILLETTRACEIIIVDDGSHDGSGEIADSLAVSSQNIRVVHHLVNLGLGGVYRTGFTSSRAHFLTFFPADGQFPAKIISQFLPLMENADLVLGFLPHRDSSPLAKCLSLFERLLYHILFSSLPKFQGIFMIRRELLDGLELKSTGRGWAIILELIIRTMRGGYRVISVPTEMRPRMSGKSKVNNPRTILANLKQAFMLRRLL